MKKRLTLIAGTVMVATAALAQTERLHIADVMKFNLERLEMRQPDAPRYADESTASLYYERPAGTMYYAASREGTMLGPVYLGVTPYTTVEFVPVMDSGTAADAQWFQYTYFYGQLLGTYDRTNDETYVNSDGNFFVNMVSGLADAAPTLKHGELEYVLGQDNVYWHGDNTYASDNYYSRIYAADPNGYTAYALPQSFTDDHSGDAYFYGAMGGSGYIWGTGTIDLEGKTYTATAVRQDFEAPMTPLCVEDIFVGVICPDQPLADGATLTMTITQHGADGSAVLATLKATADDALYSTDVAAASDSETEMKFYNLTFRPEEEFIITQPFTVSIAGLEQTGVDLGMMGIVNPEQDPMEQTIITVTDEDGNNYDLLLYDLDIAMHVTFTSYFDRVLVDDANQRNVVQLSADGTVCQSAATRTSGEHYPGASFYCAKTIDNSGTMNYEIEGLPDWITGWSYDGSNWQWAYDYVYYLTFTANPLPEGVDSRSAEVWVKGKGVTSDAPIIIRQDRTSVPTSIETIEQDTNDADAPTYSIDGKRVPADTRGIVIRNGKKLLQR